MATKFSWDASALLPETITLQFPTTAKSDSELEDVTFVEYPRLTNAKFITECVDTRVGKDVEEDDPEKPGEKRKVYQANPLVEVTEQQGKLLDKWLSEATQRGPTPKDAKYFSALSERLGSLAYGYLADMLFGLNHVAEIMMTGGNFLVLPRMIATQGAAAPSDPDANG